MKRFVFATSVVAALLSGILLARAAWPTARAAAAAPVSPISLTEATVPLDGAAGWHYRHSHPTHWRACLLQH